MVGVYGVSDLPVDFLDEDFQNRPVINSRAYRATMIGAEGGILVVGPEWSHILTIYT
jgi:hypothetical protein